MVGGVGLNFSAPLTGIDTNATDHKALGKRLLKEVVSSLLSTPVPQNCPKKSSMFTFFHVFFNVTKLKPTTTISRASVFTPSQYTTMDTPIPLQIPLFTQVSTQDNLSLESTGKK